MMCYHGSHPKVPECSRPLQASVGDQTRSHTQSPYRRIALVQPSKSGLWRRAFSISDPFRCPGESFQVSPRPQRSPGRDKHAPFVRHEPVCFDNPSCMFGRLTLNHCFFHCCSLMCSTHVARGIATSVFKPPSR